ncbi:MAG: flagellar motor switch protein FliG, partial [Luteimonas sp.]
MSGTQRAAVVLLSLGEAQAAEVLRHMDAKDVQKLGVAMATVGDVSHRMVEKVIGEFADVITQPARIGDGADEYVRAVLKQALGEERASSVIDRILTGQNTPGLDALKWMEPKAIADLVRHEHPQIIAIVLAHLEGDQGAEVLKCLPDALRGDVLMRVATLDSIPAHALTELNDVMARQFTGTKTAKPAIVGGAKVAASILNFMDAGADEALLQSISEVDGALGDEIRDLMFVFDNLATMEDRTMQAILREVSSDTLALALRGADPRVRAKVTGNMSQRAAEILIDDMESR